MTRKAVMAREFALLEGVGRLEERRKRQLSALKAALRWMAWERGYQRWRANECAALLKACDFPLSPQGGKGDRA